MVTVLKEQGLNKNVMQAMYVILNFLVAAFNKKQK